MGRQPVPLPADPVAVAGVWDVRDRGSAWYAGHPEALAWAQAHMAPWNEATYRAEFCHVDGVPAAVLHRYAEDGAGRRYLGADGEPASLPPAVLALDELPPAGLLRGEEVSGGGGDLPGAGLRPGVPGGPQDRQIPL